MTPLRNDTNLNTTVAPTTCEFVRGNGNDNAADIRAYQLTSSFDASRHFTALGNLVAIGALTNLASRRPGRFIGFLPRLVCPRRDLFQGNMKEWPPHKAQGDQRSVVCLRYCRSTPAQSLSSSMVAADLPLASDVQQ